MDLRAYYGLNNYWEPIEDNYINSYPNTINMKRGKRKSHYFLRISYRILIFIEKIINFVMKFLFRHYRNRNRDLYFDQILNE